MVAALRDQEDFYAHADAAFLSQNAQLFAAAAGSTTFVLGNVNRAALELSDERVLTFTQPVGYPW